METHDHPSLVHAKNILGPHFPTFVQIVFDAWDEWHAMLDKNGRLARAGGGRTRASVMSDFMGDLAKERFAGIPGVIVRDGRFVQVSFNGIIASRFKKLTLAGRTQNNPTQNQNEYLMQISLPNFPESIRLTVGYRLDRQGTKIEDVVLLCEKDSVKLWDLSLMTGASVQVFDMFGADVEEAAPRTATRIRPKSKPGDARSEGE